MFGTWSPRYTYLLLLQFGQPSRRLSGVRGLKVIGCVGLSEVLPVGGDPLVLGQQRLDLQETGI